MVSLTLREDDRPNSKSGGCGDCGSGDPDQKCGNGLEKVYPTTAVRYGYMRHVGEFTYPQNMKFSCGARVVVQTNRGIEIGQQVSLSCSGCDKHVSREQIKTYVENSGTDSYVLDNGRILREATPDDLSENAHLRQRTRNMERVAQQTADRCLRGEQRMRIVECEFLLGGERAIIYFTADGRVDFRALVKDLSHEFQTRIQMHQVGARDEARLLADYETCGREVCCKVFLKTLKPISMRMAKLQRATLDPTKVSGRCGRLKCCLRYEHESYEDLDSKLPKRGEIVLTAHGYGTVVDRQILTQLIRIDRPLGEGIATVVIEDVEQRKLREFPPDAEIAQMNLVRQRAAAALVAPIVPARPAQDSEPRKPKSDTRRRRSRGRGQQRQQSKDAPPRVVGKADSPSETPKSSPGSRGPRRRRRRRPQGDGGPKKTGE